MDVESPNIFKWEPAGLDGAAMSVIRIEPACVVRSGIKISVNGGPYVRSQPWNGQIDGHQLLRSGGSVAAHIREASRARSDAEFCSKLDELLQEADESQLWLELLRDDCGIRSDNSNQLLQETGELIAIFTAMVSRTKRRP
jgi:four helix bundle protein